MFQVLPGGDEPAGSPAPGDAGGEPRLSVVHGTPSRCRSPRTFTLTGDEERRQFAEVLAAEGFHEAAITVLAPLAAAGDARAAERIRSLGSGAVDR